MMDIDTRTAEYVTTGEAARMLGISPRTVQMLDDTGRLPSERTPTGRRRFRRADVQRLADERAERKAAEASEAAEIAVRAWAAERDRNASATEAEAGEKLGFLPTAFMGALKLAKHRAGSNNPPPAAIAEQLRAIFEAAGMAYVVITVDDAGSIHVGFPQPAGAPGQKDEQDG